MPDWLIPAIVAPLATVLAALSAGHALLHKRDPRSAFGWITLCLLFPFAGPLGYFLFGFNRIRTRARKLRPDPASPAEPETGSAAPPPELPASVEQLARVSGSVSRWPLVAGNRLEMLVNGEEAFPAMLAAIEGAGSSIYLSTYLFGTGEVGGRFIDALGAASKRGAAVRVLVDGVGALYSWPRALRRLRAHGVRAELFLPPRLLLPRLHLNLRNHRKILVVDGEVAFTGGMNLSERHLVERDSGNRTVDRHFRITGPVVGQIERVFFEDWEFVTGESLSSASKRHDAAGEAVCRVITDGPNGDIDRLQTILIGAVSAAKERIGIVTPYFLPARELIGALQAAALRGVDVHVLLPEKNNLPYVHWATRNLLWELLERGVRVFYQPPPFVHTKLFLVDDHYTQVGSANIDPRSLRLNFEMMVESYDRELATTIASEIDAYLEAAREVTWDELSARPLVARVRDALAWVASPYL